MTKEEIGNILKQLRLNCKMTQKQVAEIIGRKQQIIGHWETGYSQPDADTLFSLCDLYGVSIDEAFGFSKKDIKSAPKKNTKEVIELFEQLVPSFQECAISQIQSLLKLQNKEVNSGKKD